MGRIPNLVMKRRYTGNKLPCFRIVRTWFLSFIFQPDLILHYPSWPFRIGIQTAKRLTRALKCRTQSQRSWSNVTTLMSTVTTLMRSNNRRMLLLQHAWTLPTFSCYNAVTTLLQRCYNAVTALLQRCYSAVRVRALTLRHCSYTMY